jgi:hypothetical protein
MAKFYQRQNLNAQSSLFHHGLIQILVISHLSKFRDSWHNFMYRNGFTLPENMTDLPLHFNESQSLSIKPLYGKTTCQSGRKPMSIAKTHVVL